MIKPTQLRYLVNLFLSEFDLVYGSNFQSLDAVELLMMTSAQESLCGHYLYQDDGDPKIERYLAFGIYEMEPIGYKQAIHYLSIHYPMYRIPPRKQIIWDLKAATILARAYYASWPEKLPNSSNVLAMAMYYKKYWNTAAGSATIDSTIENYYEYAK